MIYRNRFGSVFTFEPTSPDGKLGEWINLRMPRIRGETTLEDLILSGLVSKEGKEWVGEDF